MTSKNPFPGMNPWLESRWGDMHLRKQKECRDGGVNLVEVDLLRAGHPTTFGHRCLLDDGRDEPCHASVWRAARPLDVETYPSALRHRLPVIAIPLRESDPDIPLNIQALVDTAFERGRHDDIDYSRPLEPPLTTEGADWCEAVIRDARAEAG